MALTAKQEKFCQHYAAHRDGGKAYRHAFDVAVTTLETTCHSEACRLLNIPAVTARIEFLVTASTNKLPAVFDLAEALRRWLEIADANPDELIGLRVGCCRHCWGDGFLYQWKEREYLEALDKAERAAVKDPSHPMPDVAGGFGFRKGRAPHPDCPECEGEGVERVVPRDTSKLSPSARRLYGGVKQTRSGVEIIIADRVKALENANRIIGAFTERVRLDGSIHTMAEVVTTEVTDPHEAARMYERMIRGPLRAN